MILFYPLNGCCEPQMGAKMELGEDESMCYYENDRITPIIAIICRFWDGDKSRRSTGQKNSGVRVLLVNPEVFDFFVERIAVNTKLNGGFGSRTAASSQNLLNEFTLDAIDDFAMQVSLFVS